MGSGSTVGGAPVQRKTGFPPPTHLQVIFPQELPMRSPPPQKPLYTVLLMKPTESMLA